MKSKLTTLRKKADRLLQEFYTQGCCLVCGKPATCVHHWIPKSQSNNLRYDPKNLVPICAGCHVKHHLSGDPLIATEILRIRGQSWADDLEKRRHEICKFTVGYLEEIIEGLK